MADTIRTTSTLLTTLFQDGQTEGITAQDLRDMIVSLNNIYQQHYTTGYADLISSVASGNTPPANTPTWTAFQPGGTGNLFAYTFDINDYIFTAPFHVNHDIKPGGNAYFHVHWTTNGTSTNSVKWEVEYSMAKGHNQETFTTSAIITVEQAASGTAYKHMVTETATPITLAEPDILIMCRLRRITNGVTDNADNVFALNLDLHYEVDRKVTPNKVPNFYA